MRSLRRKFLLAALLTHAVVAVAMLAAMYRLLDHSLQVQLEDSSARSRDLLSAALVPLLIARDLATAEELVRSLVDDASFVYVDVRDPTGRTLVSAGQVPAGRPAARRVLASLVGPVEDFHFEAPLTLNQQTLGELHFALDGRHVRVAKRGLVTWLVVLGVAGLAIAATLQGWLARHLTRRLERLADAAGRVAAGDQGLQLDDQGDDEAARLTQSFNRMSSALGQRFAALQASERRQRELTEALAEGVVFQDRDQRVLSCNEAAPRILGVSRDQLLGRLPPDPRWRAIRPDGTPFDAAERPAEVALRTGRPVRDVVMGVEPPGGDRSWVSVNSQPLFEPGGEQPYATVTSFSDITARIEAELELERANERLEARVRERTVELERARNQAEEASRAKSEFLSRMSHELRTPLNAILGFAQLLRLRGGDAAPEVGAQLGHIESAGWHLLELINDVLDLSRIEAGALAIEEQEIVLAPLVAECLRMVHALAESQQVTLRDRTAALGMLKVRGDPTRLRQVLVNLLSNACKYNRRGGSATVDGQVVDDWLELAVEDTGNGLDAGQLAAMFEPFNRLGAERSGVEGTGIGLVITRRLVELMGGELRVQSAPRAGSRFVVRLRRVGTAAASAAATSDAAPGAEERHGAA